MKHVTAFFLLAGIWLTLILLSGLAQAQPDDTVLWPGSSLTVICRDGGPPIALPPSPPFAPPVPCQPAAPPAGMTQKLIRGEHTYALSGGATTVLRFSAVKIDIDSIDIEWNADNPVAVSISRCPGDFNTDILPRRCFSGSAKGSLRMTPQDDVMDDECALTDLATYYVNLSAINILTGRPSCKIGDCEIDLTVTINSLEN